MPDLKDRVLVITGASSGIGAATAIEAARQGMRVVLAARRPDKLEQVAGRVRQLGGQVLVVATDVTDRRQVQVLMDATVRQFGRIDAIFANAGFGLFHRGIEDDAAGMEERMWAVNYFGALECIRAAGRVMIRQGQGGHILVCSSIVAFTGLPYKATYAATKAALHGLIATLRLELEPHHIDVTCVYPVATDTDFSDTADQISRPDVPRPFVQKALIQTPQHVARCILRCLRRPRPQVWPSRLSHLGAAVWTLLPRFQQWCFRKHARHTPSGLKERPIPSKASDAPERR